MKIGEKSRHRKTRQLRGNYRRMISWDDMWYSRTISIQQNQWNYYSKLIKSVCEVAPTNLAVFGNEPVTFEHTLGVFTFSNCLMADTVVCFCGSSGFVRAHRWGIFRTFTSKLCKCSFPMLQSSIVYIYWGTLAVVWKGVLDMLV